MIQGNTETIDLKYPAVTICPKVSTKYGIAERLGNYIDPNDLPDKVLFLKKELFKCGLNKRKVELSSSTILETFYKGNCQNPCPINAKLCFWLPEATSKEKCKVGIFKFYQPEFYLCSKYVTEFRFRKFSHTISISFWSFICSNMK